MLFKKKPNPIKSADSLTRGALAKIAYQPEIIFDVGVRQGTPWLYESFPDAFYILVDPQETGSEILTSAPKHYTFVNKALGSASGNLVLQEQGAMSTFLQRTALTSKKVERTYEVDVTTLDSLIEEKARNKRCALKIDTEGFETEVMHGLDKYTGQFDFVVAEVSVLNRFENAYNFSELITLFYDKGFRFYNFLNEPTPRAPRFYDCLFLQKDDPMFDTDR